MLYYNKTSSLLLIVIELYSLSIIGTSVTVLCIWLKEAYRSVVFSLCFYVVQAVWKCAGANGLYVSVCCIVVRTCTSLVSSPDYPTY